MTPSSVSSASVEWTLPGSFDNIARTE
jgi:hypothetical protein